MSVSAITSTALKAFTRPTFSQSISKISKPNAYIIGDSFSNSLSAVIFTTAPSTLLAITSATLMGIAATSIKAVEPISGSIALATGLATKLASIPYFFKNFGAKFLTKA